VKFSKELSRLSDDGSSDDGSSDEGIIAAGVNARTNNGFPVALEETREAAAERESDFEFDDAVWGVESEKDDPREWSRRVRALQLQLDQLAAPKPEREIGPGIPAAPVPGLRQRNASWSASPPLTTEPEISDALSEASSCGVGLLFRWPVLCCQDLTWPGGDQARGHCGHALRLLRPPPPLEFMGMEGE
jgi:hypothetical protein